MVLVSQVLFAVSAGIVLALGSLHLAFTFSGNRFEPRDTELLARMKEVSPFISRRPLEPRVSMMTLAHSTMPATDSTRQRAAAVQEFP